MRRLGQKYMKATVPNIVAEDITLRIHDKEWTGQLPTYKELVQIYKVSERSVYDAIQKLIARNVIYSVPGKGTYVKKKDS
jgi:DNA-binding GntR family transcriptional regulator